MNRFFVTLAGISVFALAHPVGVWAQTFQQSPTYHGPSAPAAQSLLSDFAIDDLTARIALLPDTVLADLLPATLSPLDLVAADQFITAFPQASPALLAAQPWAAPVKNLTQQPAVLRLLSGDIRWTQSLGYAFTYQAADVNRSIQKLRHNAYCTGLLRSDGSQLVVVDQGVIRILPPALVPPPLPPVVVVQPPIVVRQPVVIYQPPVCEPDWRVGIKIRIGDSDRRPRISEYRAPVQGWDERDRNYRGDRPPRPVSSIPPVGNPAPRIDAKDLPRLAPPASPPASHRVQEGAVARPATPNGPGADRGNANDSYRSRERGTRT